MTKSDVYLAHVGTALSTERLAPYLRAMSGNLDNAVRLYEWNLWVSGAFYEALASWKSCSEMH